MFKRLDSHWFLQRCLVLSRSRNCDLPVGCLRFLGSVLVRFPQRFHAARDLGLPRFLSYLGEVFAACFNCHQPISLVRHQRLLEVLGGDSPSLAHLLERGFLPGLLVLAEPVEVLGVLPSSGWRVREAARSVEERVAAHETLSGGLPEELRIAGERVALQLGDLADSCPDWVQVDIVAKPREPVPISHEDALEPALEEVAMLLPESVVPVGVDALQPPHSLA